VEEHFCAAADCGQRISQIVNNGNGETVRFAGETLEQVARGYGVFGRASVMLVYRRMRGLG